MMDALVPGVRAFEAAAVAGSTIAEAMEEAAAAAQAGADATRDMVARYGRAKFLGEKTRGYADAGATSVALLLRGFSAALAQEKEA
jgi:dihydroxyacetone kinase-like protein